MLIPTLRHPSPLAAVWLHHLPQLLEELDPWLDPFLAQDLVIHSGKIPHILASAAVLALPGALCYFADRSWRAALSFTEAQKAQQAQQEQRRAAAEAAAATAPGRGRSMLAAAAVAAVPGAMAPSKGESKGQYTGVATDVRQPKVCMRVWGCVVCATCSCPTPRCQCCCCWECAAHMHAHMRACTHAPQTISSQIPPCRSRSPATPLSAPSPSCAPTRKRQR